MYGVQTEAWKQMVAGTPMPSREDDLAAIGVGAEGAQMPDESTVVRVNASRLKKTGSICSLK